MEYNNLRCKDCLSTDIVETREGWVCRDCGRIFSNAKESKSDQPFATQSWIAFAGFTVIILGVLLFGHQFFYDIIGVIIIWILIGIWSIAVIANIYAYIIYIRKKKNYFQSQ